MAEFKFVKYVALNCDNCNCGKLFFRRGNEYRKEEAAGVKHRYCSKKCSWSRHQDGLPAFRFYVRKAKWSCQYRKRSILKFRKEGVRMEMSLTAEYLKRVWDSQGGTCPYTGFKLTLLQDKKGEKGNAKTASLDRIDSLKGYVEGNVEFVCRFINYAKNNYTKEQLTTIIGDIRNSRKIRNKEYFILEDYSI